MRQQRRSAALLILMVIGAMCATLLPAAAAAAAPARTAALPLIVSTTAPNRASDLQAVIALARTLLSATPTGTGPGQVPTSAAGTFQSAIAQAEAVANDPAADHEGQIGTLVAAGSAFLGTAAISGTVVDADRNRLAYSTFRRDLTQWVWQSKAALLTAPELHTQSAKDALQDQIDRAEKALAGQAEVPFVRNRRFVTPRPDEPIQFATEYFSRTPSYGTSSWGIKPALAWYRSQEMLADTYVTTEIPATEDTFIHSTTPTTTRGTAASLIVGNGRTTFFKWNLSAISGQIHQATVRLVNNSANNNLTYLNFESTDTWTEAALTYNTWPRDTANNPVIGPKVAEARSGSRNTRFTFDVTGRAGEQQHGDGVLSLSLTQDPPRTGLFPVEVFSKEATDPTTRPTLIIVSDDVDPAKLNAKYDEAVGLTQRLLDSATVGAGIGQYPQAKVDAARAALDAAVAARQTGEAHGIGEALVDLFDATSALRSAQVLRTDVEPTSTTFLPAGGIDELKQKINTDPVAQAAYNSLKEISDGQSLDYIQSLSMLLGNNVDMNQANSQFKLWASVNNQNFTPPAGAVSAQLEVTLPAASNETAGLGHVWLDDFRVYNGVTAGDLPLANPGAESGSTAPDNWTPVTNTGSPVLSWENGQNLANGGQRSLYLKNPTANDQGTWVNTQPIPVQAGVSHTLAYAVKVDGKLPTGVNVVLRFKDASGAFISGSTGVYTSTANPTAFAVTTLGLTGSNLSMQADAIVYAVSGDLTYARKAKSRMLWFLNDQLQGVESWLVNNVRPDNIDAYGAVQNGRNAISVATTYSLIKQSGVLSAQEQQDLDAKIQYLLLPLSDLRDRTEMTAAEAQLNTSNWETDMSAGAALLATTFTDIPFARRYLDNGRIVLEGQLADHVRADGGWPESFRYHVSTLSRFALFAKGLRNATGEDWFGGDSAVKRMFAFLVKVQTPPYEFFGDKPSTPPVGDAVLSDGDDFALLGLYAGEIASTDPDLGSQVYQTWEKAGKPLTTFAGESVALENFFGSASGVPQTAPLSLSSTALRPWGLTVVRDHFGQPDETFISLVANEQAIGHLHNDQGSFTLYANKTPLVMDPGIESYFDSSKNWYISSAAHSTVQFSVNGTYRDTPTSSTWEQDLFTSSSMDLARVSIANPAGAGRHYRNLAYVKDGLNAVVIYDQIKGAPEGVRFNLPVAATGSTITGNTVLSTGHYDTNLQTTVLQPETVQITQEFGRSAPQLPKIDGASQLNYLRIQAGQGQNLLTVLYPYRKGAGTLSTANLPTGIAGVQANRLQTADGTWAVVAVNGTDTPQQFTLPTDTRLRDAQTGTTSDSVDGSAQVTLPAGELHILQPARTDQSITFDALPGKTFGDPGFDLTATATSGLPVSYTATGACTVTGATVHLTAAGDCTIAATQPGDNNHNAAPAVTQSFPVAKATQSINFDALPGKTFGEPDFDLTATATSGLPVSYTATGACTVSGIRVTPTSAGVCTITAAQAGNENHQAAASVARDVTINNPVLDTFDRSNGAVGANWTGATGTTSYKITDNSLDIGLGGALVWKQPTFGKSQEASVILKTVAPNNPSQGVLLKVQTGSIPSAGAISVVYDAVNKGVRVSTLRLGTLTWTPYTLTKVELASGDRLTGRARPDGTVQILKNGSPVATVTLNAADQTFFNQKGGKIGVWAALAARGMMDDFAGGNYN